MSTVANELTPRERELGAIISAYNEVTDRLKRSHEQLGQEVRRLREELSGKNRQLRRRERLAALGELAAGVAHEIRNPLGGIQVFASLLRRDLADRPEACRLVDKIIKGVGTLERIVSDTLEFGRPSSPHPVRIDLDLLVNDTVELASQRIATSGVMVEVDDTFAGAALVTDPALLQRALLNLLFNAIEAAAERRRPNGGAASDGLDPAGSPSDASLPGHVVIGSRNGAGITGRGSTGDRVIITVSDNGPGIPVGLMDRIFNPFFTTKASGTGLGLSIVHQIAETLGGSVQAANRSGGGAVFSLSLPRAQADEAGTEVAQTAANQTESGCSR